MADEECGSQETGHPGSAENPGGGEHDGVQEALEGEDEVGVEEDGAEAEVVQSVHGGEKQLLEMG